MMLQFSDKITKDVLINWVYDNTPKIRHKNYMTGMSLCMPRWLAVPSIEELNAALDEYFAELKMMADDPLCEFQALAKQALKSYKTTIVNTIQNLRIASEGRDIDELTALSQVLLLEGPTDEKAFKQWINQRAEAMYNKNHYWRSFIEGFQPLTSTEVNALYLLKKNCTIISEDIVSKNNTPDSVDSEKQADLTADLSLEPLKQVQAAFQHLPAEALKQIFSNLLTLTHIDKTKLKSILKECLATQDIPSDFLTAKHVNAAYQLKEQVRSLLSEPLRPITTKCAQNITITTTKTAVLAGLFRQILKMIGFNIKGLQEKNPITGQKLTTFFMLHTLLSSLLSLIPILMVVLSQELPTRAGKLLRKTASLLSYIPLTRAGNLLNNVNTFVSFMNPLRWSSQLTQGIIGKDLSNFFMRHNFVQQLMPDAIPNFFTSILPTWISHNVGVLNNAISYINPFVWASQAVSKFVEPAVEFILDDENILPMVAVASVLAVVAYRRPELKYLYNKLKDTIIEYTGDTAADWDEVEAAFALPEGDATLLLSGGVSSSHDAAPNSSYVDLGRTNGRHLRKG
tara:strand:- start:45964 stop:47673 length:1710 start_codon:yes stop_codon:yes gene_type:complete